MHESHARHKGLIQLAGPEPDGEPRAFAPEDSLTLHEQARTWLEGELAKPFAGQTIVVTHHAPMRESLAPRYAEDLVSAGFVNHLPTLARPPASLWIHGHTHMSFDYVVNGTRFVCNPRRYFSKRRGRWENEQFAWNKVVEI